jgi:hypothetical protein
MFDEIIGDAGSTSATCAQSGANCDCTLEVSADVDVSGTYAVSGSSLTTMSTGGGTGGGGYCVQGNTLYLVAMTGSADNIVATRQ